MHITFGVLIGNPPQMPLFMDRLRRCCTHERGDYSVLICFFSSFSSHETETKKQENNLLQLSRSRLLEKKQTSSAANTHKCNFLSSLSWDRIFLKVATQAVRILMRTSTNVIDIPRWGGLNWTNKRVFSKFLCNIYGNRAISSADIQD